MGDIKFKIGQEYENRKGVYEVLAVDNDGMSIRWEDGEEVSTTESMQSRIIECMYRELASVKAKKSGRSKQPASLKHAVRFEGMGEADFSEDVEGTTWRHHNSLGGAVAVRLKSDKFDIVSWPEFRRSAIHWADLTHRHHDTRRLQARFFARLDAASLYFGLDMESSSQEGQGGDDKNAFIEWLTDPANDSWLNEVVCNQNLSICDIKKEGSFQWTIMSVGGKWRMSNGEAEGKEIESLPNFLNELTDSARLDLRIYKTVKKGDVMTRGAGIADDIAGLFEKLLPVYEATVSIF